MKKWFSRLFTASLIALAAFSCGFNPSGVLAQSAVQTPTYIPSVAFTLGTYTATVSTSTPTAAYSVQNQATLCLQFSGTFTGLAATIQGTTSPLTVAAASSTWSNLSAHFYPEDGIRLVNVTQAGLYCFSSTGLRQVRVNVTAVTLTGSNTLTIGLSGTTEDRFHMNYTERKRTYSSAFAVSTATTAAQDWSTITGSASNQIHVKEIACWGTVATTAQLETISLIKRSTLDTGGTPVVATLVPMDSGQIAATAAVNSYTVAPTSKGTVVGTVRIIQLFLPLNTSQPATFDWVFGVNDDQDLILNSATETLGLNSLTVGTNSETFNCFMKWEEQ